MIHLIHRQLVVGIHGTGDGGVVDSGGDVDAAAGGGDVEREEKGAGVAGLSSDGVADGLELGEGEEGWENVEEDQRHFLLIVEGVEDAGLEGGEGGVGWGEDAQAVGGFPQLRVDAVGGLGEFEEADECCEAAGLFKNLGYVGWTGRSRSLSLSLNQGFGALQENDEEEREREVFHFLDQ